MMCKKIALFLLCFCALPCFAQTEPFIILPRTVDLKLSETQIKDSVETLTELERLFWRRTNERMTRLDNNVKYLLDNRHSRRQKRYCIKETVKLFVDTAQVTVKWGETKEEKLSIKKFLNKIARDTSLQHVLIDSILIPRWDIVRIENDTLGIVYVDGELVPFGPVKQFEEGQTKLPVISENTVDGPEWVPLFGNIIVTKTKKDEENNNCSIDDIGDNADGSPDIGRSIE